MDQEIPASDSDRTFEPDPIKLFRISVLSFNGHRNHYARDYARQPRANWNCLRKVGRRQHGSAANMSVPDFISARQVMYDVHGFEDARFEQRRASENFIGGDIHDGLMPLASEIYPRIGGRDFMSLAPYRAQTARGPS